MHLELVRFAYLTKCTLGVLTIPDAGPIMTIERPWIPNELGPGGKLSASCVPDGCYRLQPYDSPKHGKTWCLVNPGLGVHFDKRPLEYCGRTMIQIHVANRAEELEGCIAPGMKFGDVGGHSVYESGLAMGVIREKLGGSFHVLRIRPSNGTAEVC